MPRTRAMWDSACPPRSFLSMEKLKVERPSCSPLRRAHWTCLCTFLYEKTSAVEPSFLSETSCRRWKHRAYLLRLPVVWSQRRTFSWRRSSHEPQFIEQEIPGCIDAGLSAGER